MRLAVPTNWDDVLIERLADMGVAEIVGGISHPPMGPTLSTVKNWAVSTKQAGDHMRQVVDSGMGFTYLANAPCLENMEYDPSLKEEIVDQLKWAVDQGCTAIIVSNAFLVRLLKKHLPSTRVINSYLSYVDNVEKAQWYGTIGVDEMTVDVSSNRNFPLLKQFQKIENKAFRLKVNKLCLFQCPFGVQHGFVIGHEAGDAPGDSNHPDDYAMNRCTLRRINDPEALLKSRWIRPEDLDTYEGLGYETFEIEGGEMSTEWIVNTARAYSDRIYQGNLMDILHASFLTYPDTDQVSFSAIKPPRIENDKLKGFLEFFKTIDCKNSCVDCDHCKDFATRSVTLFSEENRTVIADLERAQGAAFDL